MMCPMTRRLTFAFSALVAGIRILGWGRGYVYKVWWSSAAILEIGKSHLLNTERHQEETYLVLEVECSLIYYKLYISGFLIWQSLTL